jgi:hypothetical protein
VGVNVADGGLVGVRVGVLVGPAVVGVGVLVDTGGIIISVGVGVGDPPGEVEKSNRLGGGSSFEL